MQTDTLPSLHDDMASIVGPSHVSDDLALRRLHSEDVFAVSDHVASLVVTPQNTADLAAVVATAHRHGLPLSPRGAGMSYTSGYIPATETSLSIDLTAMNRILSINADDMTVTVEAGCTWAALNAALAEKGLRTPFWGPMSGIYSTIGGGVSQLNAMFGAGHHGTSSESVIAMTVVLGDGQLLRTGARGADGDSPFYRHFGPDLAGLFCGDCGTLGIKAEITLRLMRMPAHEDYASFSFKTGAGLLRAMAEMARAGIACEMCGFDPGLTRVRMRRMSLMSDMKTLGAVIGKQKSLGKGLMAAAKLALGGRDFIEADEYPLHVIAEGRCAEAVAHDMATARRIAREHEGVEIENSIAKVIRAMPFPPPNSMLGPDGESWAPVHALTSLSAAPKVFDEIESLFARMAPEFDRFGVATGYLFSSMSTNGVIIEPVFFWPQGYRPVHQSMVEPAHLARLPKLDPNPAANDVVTRARKGVTEIAARHGCGHFQIGRSYPYRQSRDAASLALLDQIKALVDPKGQLNPGGLGFPQ
ncbi:FAD-binding oxidoreductase [Polymorphobacter sp.]|uniref:FAD-binding oxidoreductase n=1 Tax=Polymorphobacter sp. TaxID=1909290 RepID=UPI003F726355